MVKLVFRYFLIFQRIICSRLPIRWVYNKGSLLRIVRLQNGMREFHKKDDESELIYLFQALIGIRSLPRYLPFQVHFPVVAAAKSLFVNGNLLAIQATTGTAEINPSISTKKEII